MNDEMIARLRWSAGDSYEQTEAVDDPFLLGHIHGLCDDVRQAADRIEALIAAGRAVADRWDADDVSAELMDYDIGRLRAAIRWAS